MKTYIVLDLEWNQSADGKERAKRDLPFEIIEVGAIKLDENLKIISEFRRVVKPVVYKKLHFKVMEVIHLGIDELKKQGAPFKDVAEEFLNWCYMPDDKGEFQDKPIFCTWGNMDLTELQRNMAWHKVNNPFPYPFLYYDIQKLYSLLYVENSKDKKPLDHAVEEMLIEEDRPFHSALDDAFYTARIFQEMDFEEVKEYMSLDYFTKPQSREDEIYLVFPDYSKYVSMPFESKEDAIADKTVTDMLCYRCKRMLRKKIRWFSANQKNYYCLAYCPEHGFVKGKIRMKHTRDDRVFVVKTIKLINDDGAADIVRRKEEATRKRNEKNKIRRQKARMY